MKKLLFATADNGMGLSRTSWAVSMMGALLSLARTHNMEVKHISNPYPDGSMNFASDHFMRGDCDEMIVIDTDVKFQPSDLAKLLSHDAPFVSGLYTKKMPGLHFIAEPVEGIALPYTEDANRPNLREFKRVAKGFLRLKREVFETLQAVVPEIEDPRGGTIYEYWKTLPGGHSEDFEFCDKYRRAGGKVMVDISLVVQHEGTALWPLLETCRVAQEVAA